MQETTPRSRSRIGVSVFWAIYGATIMISGGDPQGIRRIHNLLVLSFCAISFCQRNNCYCLAQKLIKTCCSMFANDRKKGSPFSWATRTFDFWVYDETLNRILKKKANVNQIVPPPVLYKAACLNLCRFWSKLKSRLLHLTAYNAVNRPTKYRIQEKI